MSRQRIAIALAVVVALGAIAMWQHARERQVTACVSDGGVWNGTLSRCEAKRPVILERDGLKRG